MLMSIFDSCEVVGVTHVRCWRRLIGDYAILKIMIDYIDAGALYCRCSIIQTTELIFMPCRQAL